MDLDELALQTHEPVEELQRWRHLGLLPGDNDDDDCERTRFIQFARQRGITPDAIARVSEQQGDVIGSFIDLLVPTAGKRTVNRETPRSRTKTSMRRSRLER